MDTGPDRVEGLIESRSAAAAMISTGSARIGGRVNGSAREAMQSDTLRLMARELTEMVKKMPKLDWTQRESVRASLRRNVRQRCTLRTRCSTDGWPVDATQLVLRSRQELSTR